MMDQVPVLHEHHKRLILDVLLGQSLADHLGDVRDEEDTLWLMLGVSPAERRRLSDYDSPFEDLRKITAEHDLEHLLPDWARRDYDE